MTRIVEFAVRTVICFATIAWAFDPTLIRAARRAPFPANPPGRAGLVVEVDPPPGETSATVGGAETARRMANDAALTRSTDGLQVQMLADGSRRVDLQGRFRSYSVVTLSADGTLGMACADDQASAIALARAAALRSPADRAPRLARARALVGPREE